MVYNTGALSIPSTRNSIIDESDVRQYLKITPVSYELPLDFAWPTYGWGVWFRDGQFHGLLHHTDYSDKSVYALQPDGTLCVCRAYQLEGHALLPGDIIRPEIATYTMVSAVKSLVSSSFSGQANNILYHLDSVNLSNYSFDEVQNLFYR